ncbi:MAG: MaoC family dehydratase [Myxococcota bacterium]
MTVPTVIPDIPSIKDFVGKPLGTSDWITIDQDRIDTFAKATGDHQWIHCDAERARRESPFKDTIAHGYLTLSLVPVLLAEVVIVNNCETVINTGLEKVRLSAPVLAGSRVRMSAKLTGTRDVPGGAVRATFRIRFEVEGSAKPACHGYVTYVYYPS